MNLIKLSTGSIVRVNDNLTTLTGLDVEVLRIDHKRNKVMAAACCNNTMMSYHPSELRCAWASPIAHPLEKGTRVTVHNLSISGEPVIEGEATIIKYLQSDTISHLYEVRFDGETQAYERWLS